MKNPYLLLSLYVFVVVFYPSAIFADSWFYQPIFSAQGNGETNRQLRSSDEKGTAGIDGRAGVKLSRKSENTELFLSGIFHSQRYDGSEDRGQDSDNQLFYSGGNWIGERARFSMNGEYLRQATSITELEDTGFVETNDRRVTRSLAPEFSYILFEDTQVFVGGSYTDVEFPNTTPVSLTEYELKGGNAGIVYSFDELNSITFSGFYSDYEAQTFVSDVESSGGSIRYNKIFNEQWEAYVGLGFRKSNFKFINNLENVERDSDTGETYELGATYEKSELERFNFSLVNELQPSASGNVNDRLSFRVDYIKQLSPRVNGVIDSYG